MYKIAIGFALVVGLQACQDKDLNLNDKGQNLLEANQIYTEKRDLLLRDTVYVPIYSDIYSKTKDVRFNLTATLSIRNTSLSDSIYIEDIDYYDSNGRLVRNYLEKVLLLRPMHSIEYVIEEDDTEGGTGANFIINWGATVMDVKPVFQGVMISTHGQQGISFLTEGVSISRKNL
ncbi:MAG: DUF3124 domain-containing protein [Saprospiraceae bacterium]